MPRDRVLRVIESVLGRDLDGATELNLESMKMLELVVAIEQEFGIEIPQDAPIVRIMSSVDELVAYVDKNRIK